MDVGDVEVLTKVLVTLTRVGRNVLEDLGRLKLMQRMLRLETVPLTAALVPLTARLGLSLVPATHSSVPASGNIPAPYLALLAGPASITPSGSLSLLTPDWRVWARLRMSPPSSLLRAAAISGGGGTSTTTGSLFCSLLMRRTWICPVSDSRWIWYLGGLPGGRTGLGTSS